MNNAVLEKINDLLGPVSFFSGNTKEDIHDSAKKLFPNISENEILEIEEYLNEFYDYCSEFADILAFKYKVPFLPKSEDAKIEIAEYVRECQNKYPEIDEKHILSIFGNTCWLTNR